MRKITDDLLRSLLEVEKISNSFMCVCGHALVDHDLDIELCFDCLDRWYHMFCLKPKTWFVNVSFTPKQ